MNDISRNMKYVGKKTAICNHFCKNKPRNTKFYAWYTFFDSEFIKEMCQTCAFREVWGSSYKQGKNYKKWIAAEGE